MQYIPSYIYSNPNTLLPGISLHSGVGHMHVAIHMYSYIYTSTYVAEIGLGNQPHCKKYGFL